MSCKDCKLTRALYEADQKVYKAQEAQLKQALGRIAELEKERGSADRTLLDYVAEAKQLRALTSIQTGRIAELQVRVDAQKQYVADKAEECLALRDGLRDMFRLLDEGFLVRDISRDGEPGWSMRMLKPMARMKKAFSLLEVTRQVCNHPTTASNGMGDWICGQCAEPIPAPTAQDPNVCEHGVNTLASGLCNKCADEPDTVNDVQDRSDQ